MSASLPSSSSMSSTQVSLPSIHEMFPDHLMRKNTDSHVRPRSHRGYPHLDSPGAHHLESRHRVSVPEPQSTSSDRILPSRHAYELPVDKKRHSTADSLQNVYTFDVLRSSPTSASLQHITSSSKLPSRPANPQQLGGNSVVASGSSPAFRISVPASSDRNESHEGQNFRRVPETMMAGFGAISSPRTRASGVNDPYPAIISSHSEPLPSGLSKHHQYYSSQSPGPGPGAQGYEDSYPRTFNGGINRHEIHPSEEEDDGPPSGGEDNDSSHGKKHVCNTCFKRFNRPSSLRIHVNTHTGATPFRCPWPNCGREFNVNSNMRRHYRNHTTPGFSRSQSSSNPHNVNSHPSDARRKRRRVGAPQIPLPTSATAPSPGPHSTNPYPLNLAPYRPEYQYRHPPAPQHHPHHAPYSHHALNHRSHPHPQQYLGPSMHSPPISNLSVSDGYSSSGSDSDIEEDAYPAPPLHVNPKKEIEDELLEYEPDASLGYRTAGLTHSLARVAVASSNGISRKVHPYGLYSPTHTSTHDEPRRRPGGEQGPAYGHRNEYSRPQRPLTPGSGFVSSSPSPSVSPSPPPSRAQANLSHISSHSNYKYSASMPYVRSLADSRVSTTLRPAFGKSSEREKPW